jgi:hypothetical protein
VGIAVLPFDFLIPLVPLACVGDLAWREYRHTGLHLAHPDDMLTEPNMRAAFYIHSPLAHSHKIAKERILIAAGAGDRIVPPEHPSVLWEHWERPAIHWFTGRIFGGGRSGVDAGGEGAFAGVGHTAVVVSRHQFQRHCPRGHLRPPEQLRTPIRKRFYRVGGV